MIDLIHHCFFSVIWIGWVSYWWIASFNVKTATRQEDVSSRFWRLLPLVMGGTLLGVNDHWLPALYQRFLPVSEWLFWIGAAVALIGMLLALWARHSLGRN